MRIASLLAVLLNAGSALTVWSAEDPFAANVRPTEPLTAEQQLATFKVPPEFEVQLVASEPDINKPMNLAFDALGRLWVTTSREYPYPAPLDRPGRDRVMIFEDFGPDGRARKVTEFASGLNIPIGVYPFRSPGAGGAVTFKAIVWSIPNIWLMEDVDGDGKVDRKERLYGPFDHTRDTHGNQASFRRGFDGWLYATHGFNNDSRVAGRDGHEVHFNSGNTYRVRLDGSRIEHHTWGQVNPFGLAWDPAGNLYSSDCHSEPLYLLIPGGYYPSFGKPHDGLGFAPNLMEQLRGSTAIDGVTYIADDLWPAEYRDCLLFGDVMTSRIYRDRAVRRGSGRVAKAQPDFVTTTDPWFRPVDTTLGPDGALYIADFYNRIIGHYEVPLDHPGRDRERGRIWRVVPRAGTRPVALAQDLEGLVRELGSPSLSRRLLAMNDLADRFGSNAVRRLSAVLEAPDNAYQQVHALWLLNRLGALAEVELAASASDPELLVRIHAMRIIADRAREIVAAGSDQMTMPAVLDSAALAGLGDSNPEVQRCAAEALGVLPAYRHLRPVLEALRHAPATDTHLVYTLRQTLRNLLRNEEHFSRVLEETFSEKDLRAIAGVCPSVRSSLAGKFLLKHLSLLSEDAAATREALTHIARYGPPAEAEELIRTARERAGENLDAALHFFRAIQQGYAQRGMSLPEAAREWGTTIAGSLLEAGAGGAGETTARLVAGAEIAVAMEAETLTPRLRAIAKDPALDPAARAAAARGVHKDPLARAAADIVADASLPRPWRARLADAAFNPGPEGIEAFSAIVYRDAPQRFQARVAGLATISPERTARLVEEMKAGKVPTGVLQDRALRQRLLQTADGETRVALEGLVNALPDEDAALRRVVAESIAGFSAGKKDVEHGREVFVAACAACHQINGEGGLVGPQLTGIGNRGLERLCEDVLAPNLNVDHAFWTTELTTRDGETVTGLFRREEGDLLVLANSAGQEFTVPKSEVKERRESNLSLMPSNYAEALSPSDLNDLLAFLLDQRGTDQALHSK